jgi:hypothetical protein
VETAEDVTAAETPSANPDARPVDYSTEAGGAVHRLITACITDARNNSARKERDRQDWRNLLFERGGESQWTVWDRGTDRFVVRGTDPERGGLPEYIPRCVTNLFSNKIQGIAAILNQSEPAKEYSPATDDDGDVAAAEVAENAIPVLLEEIEYTSDLKPRATPLVCLTDKVVFVPYYDTDPKYGMQVIPDYQCLDCQLQVPAAEGEDEEGNPIPCPSCAKPLEMAVGPNGAPLGPSEPVGKLCCELVPSFESSFPKHARAAHASKMPWILLHTRMAVDQITTRWPDAKKLDLDKSRSGSASSSGMLRHFADAMALLSAPRRAQEARGTEGLHEPVVYRLMHDPIVSADYHYPDGLFVTMVDDQIIEAKPLPVKDDKGRRVKPAVIWQFQSAPGTVFGKPPADDLVPLQESRNIIESLLMLILQHDAAPTTFIPLSVTLENELSGVPGENVYYRSTVPGEKPTRERGLNPPEGLYKQLELIDQKMDEISRLNSVLQGARPEGDPTLGEIQILQERGMSAFRPALDRLVSVEKELCKLLLWIARDSAWSPRFRQVMGENGEWDVQQFTGHDLAGAIDIRIDSASAWPKSPLMQRMKVKEAFAMGLFPPAATDPELAQKLLSLLDLAQLKPSMDLDRKQVARKIGRWKSASTPQAIAPPDPVTENLPIHFVLLTNFLKTEEFETFRGMNPDTAGAMVMHVQAIGSMLAAQAAAAAAPAGAQDQKAGGADPLEGAVASGALRPADGEPKPVDPMQALTAAGALRPADAAQGGVTVDQLVQARALQPLNAAEPGGPPM